MHFIPYGRQQISQADIDAVVAVLTSDFLTQGKAVPQFEQDIQHYVGVQHCVAVNSATSALHLACLALGLKNDDVLWTSPISFVASSNCARYCGAMVDFVDIDSKTYTMCPNKLEAKLQKVHKIPKIVVPVHMAGSSCDMSAFKWLAERYGFFLLEDASHAIGGEYQQSKVGSCAYSDACVFSFHPVKIITTGEGGVICTNDKQLHEKMVRLRSHGITRDRQSMHDDQGEWYYEQLDLGFNYRMTDIQAALGSSQLKRLDDFIDRRRAIAQRYDHALQDYSLTRPFQADYQHSAYHLYIIQVLHRKQVYDALRAKNIGVNVHYIPIHLQPYYQKLGFKRGDFPIAEQYYAHAMSIPIFPALSDEAFQYIVDSLKQVIDLN
jgi:UDP-4-amino-4,6-dideoxy-N-acetyl-beta-L-altrosamine transaminase